MQRPKAPELLILVLAAVLLAGSVVGLTRNRDTAPPDVVAGGTEVSIVDFAFAPGELAVSVGDTVTFTTLDRATHTATGKGQSAVDSPDIGTDESYEVTFDAAGSYEYLCKFHPFMVGTITVEG